MTYNYKNYINYTLLQKELNNCLTKSYIKDIQIKIDHCISFFNAESNLRVRQFKRNIDILNINKNEIDIELNSMSNIIFKLFVDVSKNLRDFIEEKCENILPQYNIKKIDLVQNNVLREIYNHYLETLNECKNEKLVESNKKIFKFIASKFIAASYTKEICICLYSSNGASSIYFPEKHSLSIFPNNKVLNSIVSFSREIYSMDLDDQDSKDFISYLDGLGIDYKEIEIKE